MGVKEQGRLAQVACSIPGFGFISLTLPGCSSSKDSKLANNGGAAAQRTIDRHCTWGQLLALLHIIVRTESSTEGRQLPTMPGVLGKVGGAKWQIFLVLIKQAQGRSERDH